MQSQQQPNTQSNQISNTPFGFKLEKVIEHCQIFSKDGPQDEAIRNMKPGNILFAQDVSQIHNAKRYLLFDNEEYAMEYASKNNALYEFIFQNKNTCIVYDIDLAAKNFGRKNIDRELKEKTILNFVLQHVQSVFQKYNKIPIFEIDNASSEDKASYHIKIANIYVANFADYKYEAQILNNEIKEKLKDVLINDECTAQIYENHTIIDWLIYSRNRVFRFKGQGKCRNSRVIVSQQELLKCFVQYNRTFTPEMEYFPLQENEQTEQEEESKSSAPKKQKKQIPKDFEQKHKERINEISKKTIFRKTYKESQMAKIFRQSQNLNVITKKELIRVLECIGTLLQYINAESENWFSMCNFLARLDHIFEEQFKSFDMEGLVQKLFVNWGASDKYEKYQKGTQEEKKEIEKINIKLFKKFREETVNYTDNPATHLTLFRMVKTQMKKERKPQYIVNKTILTEEQAWQEIKSNIKYLRSILSKNIDQYLENCKSTKTYEKIHTQFLDSNMLNCEETILLCKSEMKTGKSYCSLEHAILENYGSIVAVSIKVMQSMQHVQDFESIKKDFQKKGLTIDKSFERMVSYQEFPGIDNLIPKQKIMTVCINSLYKITECDYLYIDEIDSFLKQLDDYQKIDRNLIFQKLGELFRKAKKIFLSSANVNVHTDIFLEGILKACGLTEKDVKYVENTYKPQKDRLYKMYETKNELFEVLQNQIVEKKNIMICCDSYAESEKITRFILQNCGINKDEIKNMLSEEVEKAESKTQKLVQAINSRTSNFQSVKNIIALKNYPKYLVISPSIIQGISIPEQYYDSMFCVYKSQSIDPMDMLQQSFRLRSNTDAHIFVQKNTSIVFYNSRQKQIDFYQKHTDLLNKDYFVERFDNNTFKICFDFNEFTNKMMLENMYQKSYMKQNFQGRLKTLILDLGAKIEYVPRKKKATPNMQIILQMLKTAEENFEEDRAEQFEATAMELQCNLHLQHKMIYKLSKKQFAVGFDMSKKKTFLYKYTEENKLLAQKYLFLHGYHVECEHPWKCDKCCLHFKTKEDVNGIEIEEEQMNELCIFMANPKTRKIIVFLSAGVYYDKYKEFINQKFITDTSLFLSSYQQQIANFQKLISLVGFSMEMEIAEPEKKIVVSDNIIYQCRRTIDHKYAIPAVNKTITEIRNATFFKIYKILEKLEKEQNKVYVEDKDNKVKRTTETSYIEKPILCINILKKIM